METERRSECSETISDDRARPACVTGRQGGRDLLRSVGFTEQEMEALIAEGHLVAGEMIRSRICNRHLSHIMHQGAYPEK
jgi:hypothetical protein